MSDQLENIKKCIDQAEAQDRDWLANEAHKADYVQQEANRIQKLVEERGKSYGHPRDNFLLIHRMWKLWVEERQRHLTETGAEPHRQEDALRHGVYMILTKLGRLATTIDHLDSLDDIQGYIDCMQQCLQKTSGRAERPTTYDQAVGRASREQSAAGGPGDPRGLTQGVTNPDDLTEGGLAGALG